MLAITVAVGIVAGTWFGYEVYREHAKDAEVDHQLGVEEWARKNAEDSLVDVIADLEQTPTFNGPTAPMLGLGTETTEP